MKKLKVGDHVKFHPQDYTFGSNWVTEFNKGKYFIDRSKTYIVSETHHLLDANGVPKYVQLEFPDNKYARDWWFFTKQLTHTGPLTKVECPSDGEPKFAEVYVGE